MMDIIIDINSGLKIPTIFDLGHLPSSPRPGGIALSDHTQEGRRISCKRGVWERWHPVFSQAHLFLRTGRVRSVNLVFSRATAAQGSPCPSLLIPVERGEPHPCSE